MSSRYLPLWLLVQLLALGASAAEIPLSAHFPRPPESMASRQMAVVQIGVAALIFPGLLADVPGTLFAIAASVPMLALAGLLSGDTWPSLAWAAAIVIGWLFTLAWWSQIPRTPYGKGILVALASLFALAGPLLAYLQAEYTPDRPIPWNIGPIQGALAALAGSPPWPTLAALFILASAGCIARFLRRPIEK